MKAILEFNLPDDQEEFERATKAQDLCRVLWEMDNAFRGYQYQYEEDRLSAAKYKMVEELWQKFVEIKEANGIDLERIYT